MSTNNLGKTSCNCRGNQCTFVKKNKMQIYHNLRAVLFLFLSFHSVILRAQTFIASDKEAIDVFKTHPSKYGFEGVYDIYKDTKTDRDIEGAPDEEYKGYKSTGEKICIFFDGFNIKALVIGQKPLQKGKLIRDGWLDAFKVDAFGILTYNWVYRSVGLCKVVPDNEYQKTTVLIDKFNLFFEETSNQLFFTRDNGSEFGWRWNYKYYFKRIYTPESQSINISPDEISSGTGFAITSNGLIATNNHVVNGSKNISVKGVNGDFSKSYNAKVITVDKNNDLAIIQISDPNFKGLGTIPYVISSKTSDAGSSVFVLGYPLRASMGDEIKLTNGIISSKSGYQGDVTTYQTSVPVQPGNSGGAMYDSKGKVVGIINAKLIGAENASYAIKTPYLISLIETLPTVPKLQTVSPLSNLPLTEQVKQIKKYTYIIEVN
jgi:S1-C subfamily serine protease